MRNAAQLSLLTALLLSGPPSVRAADDPAADTNGDGTVSGKERRQQRRADRRARRGNKGPNGETLSDEELDAAEAAESSARGSDASAKAASAASALKNSMPSADASGGLPGGAAGDGAGGSGTQPTGGRMPDAVTSASAGRSTTAPAGSAQTSTGDPGRPKSPSDFALSARSGYAPAFAAAGLKLGPDGKSVIRLDGKPATPEDYARLQREIGSMPAALGRRPDFFSSVSPEHYADLKRGYKEKKEGDRVYKDVGTTPEDRDFVHTASCSKLSGDCNVNVEKSSYKKGDFVAPEDLDNMWDALQKEIAGSAEAGGLPNPGATRSQVAREKAMDAARALSGALSTDAEGVRATNAPLNVQKPTSVSQAVASVRRLWKNVATLTLPGTTESQGSGSNPLLLIIGGLGAGALLAGTLFLRRKG